MPGTLPPDDPSLAARGGSPAAPRADDPLEASVLELSSSVMLEEGEEGAPAPTGDAAAIALVGSVISGRYLVGELLGQGGMGAVYRGEQVHLRKHVAIKVLRPTARRLPELVARFEREAIAGAHVQHPNVVASIDFGQLDDQSYFLVLEFVEGTPLRDALDAGPFEVRRALRVARQIASALEAVHAKGIVHRDLKPQNVMLDAQDHVKVIDFGLAKVRIELLSSVSRSATRAAPALTGAGTVFGTLSYLAPEAIRGMDAVDARADLYALGIVMYELLSGKHPFEAKDAVMLFRKQRSEEAPSFRVRAPEVQVPPQVEAIVLRLLQREPERRYQTATETIAALDAALAGVAGVAGLETASQFMPPAALGALGASAPAGAGAGATPVGAQPAQAPPGPGAVATVPAPARRASSPAWLRPALVAAALGPLLVVGLVVMLVVRRSSPPPKAPPPVVTSAPAAPAPAASTPRAPALIDGLDSAGWGARLKNASATKNWIVGSKAVVALAQLDPELVTSRAQREDVIAVAAGIAFEPNNELGNQVFDVLTHKLGGEGLDLLFDIVRSRGSTKAGRRASDILSQPEVMERASPGLRITFELRKVNCSGKRALLGRAAEEGDQRTLHELQSLHGARCKNPKDPCCFREDPAVVDALQKLKARLEQQ